MPARFWMTLSTEEFRRRDMRRSIAILPTAAIEQHGPHLPVGVDTLINEGYLARMMPLVPEDLDVLVLPTQAIGKSNEHIAFPGTLTLSAETTIRAWTEIGDSVHRAGVRKLIFLNSHGGNVPVIDIVARDLRVRNGMVAVNCAWHRLGVPGGLFSDTDLRHGIHAGDMETSLVLALRADLVRMDKAAIFAPRGAAMEQRFKHLRATQPIGFGWMTEDLHPSGAIGEAALATAEKGEACLAHGAAAFVDLLRDVDAFELDDKGEVDRTDP
jgi:creatinine amidohydrolase